MRGSSVKGFAQRTFYMGPLRVKIILAWGAKMSLTLTISKYVALHSNSNTTSKHATNGKYILYAKQPMGNVGDQLPMKNPIELEDKL